MKIEYGVEVPKSDREDVNAMYKFIGGAHTTMKLTYADSKDAKNSQAIFKRLVEKQGWKVEIKRIDAVLYVEKVGE